MGGCVIVLCAAVFLQVLLRYAIKVSFPAIEEIVSISFIYTVFLGAAVGMKRMEHLNIDFVLERVPSRIKKIFHVVIYTGTAIFLVFVLVEGVLFVRDSYEQKTPYLNMPISYSYAVIPLSALTMLYYLMKHVYSLLRRETGRGPVIEEDGT